MTKDKMTDLQKQIEELRNDFSEMENLTHEGEEFDLGELWKVAREAMSIVKQLQEENNAYISCLRRINSCDDSATQQSREAHQVLKQFGKL